MARGYARLRERNQLTLPAAVVEQIGLRSGDIVEFATAGVGLIELRPARIVRALLSSVDEFRKHVEKLRKGAAAEKPAKAEHLSDSQRKDVEAVVETTFLKLLSELVEQSKIRKHEEGPAERRKLRSKAGESV